VYGVAPRVRPLMRDLSDQIKISRNRQATLVSCVKRTFVDQERGRYAWHGSAANIV